MTQAESRIPEIKGAGGQLAFIAAEKRGGVWRPGRFFVKHPIESVFLLDEDRTVTRDYGLHHALGADAINIAHPATFVIDRNRWVRYIYGGANQTDRAPLDAVLKILDELRN